MQKGKYGDAAIQFKNALRFDPQFVNAHYQLAQAQLAGMIGKRLTRR